ncbi:unnamed protein product [Cladocopium goreaui]|uniref:F5/8 type C domain-containing protein n=1 Tax=Cladocopium goreaui TaxID=2562237 RepID=A0A9P1M4Y8_9DINO|nr:unnamed protein product [Cladocopium goreaui]
MCLVAPAAEDPSAEACEDAVLLGDGREIWRLEPSGHLVSQDGRCLMADSTGVRLTGQCDTGPGQAWQLLGTNQLQLDQGAEGMCLTLSSSPLVDVAQGQSAHATSSIDAFHSAEQAVDGTSSSYWAADPEDQEKIFWISFPQTRLKMLDINWEYPPDAFQVELTKDGVDWEPAYAVDSNMLHATRSRIPLKGQETIGMRLRLHASDKQLVGIRTLQTFSLNNLPGLEPCETPKMARDKWFLSSVTQFDPTQRLRKADYQLSQLPENRQIDESWVVEKPPERSSPVVSFLESLTPSELKPLTQWRQQHRRTLEGFLCAAAFVQDGQVYTNCTDAPTPQGDSGREWCYLDPQLQDLQVGDGTPSWGYCARVVDYDALRKQ